MMTVSYETLLKVALVIGIVFTVITWIWLFKNKSSKGAKIANIVAIAFLTIVGMGKLISNLLNGESWKIAFFVCCIGLINVTLKIISLLKSK